MNYTGCDPAADRSESALVSSTWYQLAQRVIGVIAVGSSFVDRVYHQIGSRQQRKLKTL